MAAGKPHLETSRWSPTVDAAAVKWLRLIAEPEGPRLAYGITWRTPGVIRRHITTVMSRAVSGWEETPLVQVLQLLPPPPAFDLVRLPSGGYELVYESTGGATYSLRLRRTLSADEELVPGQPVRGSFSGPRFVGDAGAPAPILADNDGHIVVFTRPAAGPPDAGYRRIVAGQDAAALRTTDGHLLLYKVRVPGAVRNNDICRGALHALRLSADFEPQAAPVRPLGDQIIYELDAATCDGRAFVVVTTQAGVALLGSAPGGGGELALLHELSHDRPLSSPTMVRDGAGLAMAFLEDAGTEDARFLHVSLRL